MADLTAKRTLVKSPPELWSELSEVERLARHLGAFGEIKITKLEPEHTVAWEGEAASGTVSIEPSGWGTKVTLTAQVAEAKAARPELEWEGEPPEFVLPPPSPPRWPEPLVEPEPPRRQGFFARFFGRKAAAPEPAPVPAPAPVLAAPPPPPPPPPEPEPEPAIETEKVQAVLDETLEALGSAHHRPFSRG